MLAWISHQLSAAAANLLAVTRRTPSSRFDVVSATPSAARSALSVRAPCHRGILTPSRRKLLRYPGWKSLPVGFLRRNPPIGVDLRVRAVLSDRRAPFRRVAPPVASRTIAGPRERWRPSVHRPRWTRPDPGIRCRAGRVGSGRISGIRGGPVMGATDIAVSQRERRGAPRGRAGRERPRRRAPRGPGLGFATPGLRESEHRDQHGHEKKRPPEPSHPARTVRHPHVIRSEEREILYAAGVPPKMEGGPTPGHVIGGRRGPNGTGESPVRFRLRPPSGLDLPLHPGLEVCHDSLSGAGWSRLAARRAHNPKVGGSNPPPATKSRPAFPTRGCRPLHFRPQFPSIRRARRSLLSRTWHHRDTIR